MDNEVYFESPKVSQSKINIYEKGIKDKLEEIKYEIIEELYKKHSIKIDIKNNCIIKNNNGKT